jgi:hypothetical protein
MRQPSFLLALCVAGLAWSGRALAITSPCTLNTVGLPCDPDGNGPATECEGVCWVGANRQPTCQSLASLGMQVNDVTGRICGDATGQDCARSCVNGQCVTENASVGTACRPTATSNTCDGLCTLSSALSPTCLAVAVCSNVGLNACVLHACGFDDNTTGCQDYPLPRGTTCDDGLSCTSGDACNAAGDCVPAVNNCGGGGAPGATGGRTGLAGRGPTGTGGFVGTVSRGPADITGGGCSTGGRASSAWGYGLLLLLGLCTTRRRR